MQPLFWQRERAVASGLAAIFSADRLATLQAELDAPAEDEAGIAVIGPFNAGKSTLLNRLLARDLLPCRDFTETGTAVRLRSGPTLAARASDGRGGWRPIAPTTAGLLAVTSLLDDDGLRRFLGEIVAEVEIELPDLALPFGAVLVDTPGLNDDGTTDRRTLDMATRAERIVFVLGSRHFLAESDLDHLGLLLVGRDPTTIQLVLNIFIDAPDRTRWDAACTARLPVYRQRLKDRVLAIGLTQQHIDDLVVVCAATPRDGADMGLADVRRMLDRLAAGARRDTLARRKVRIALALHELGAALRAHNEGLRQALADHAARVGLHEEGCARDDDLKAAVKASVAAAQKRFAHEAKERASEIAKTITKVPIAGTGALQASVDAAIARESRGDAEHLVAELRQHYAADVAITGFSALFEIAPAELTGPPEGFAVTTFQSAARPFSNLSPKNILRMKSFEEVGKLVGDTVREAVDSTTGDVQQVIARLKESVLAAAARAVAQRSDRIAEIEDRLYEAFHVEPVARPDDEEAAALDTALREGEALAAALADAIDRLAGRAAHGSLG